MFMSGTRDDAANIDAINVYMMAQPLNTPEAAKIRDEWVKWHDALGWYDSSLPSIEIYDQARDIRNRFNLANAKTSAEKADVKQAQQTGLSSEELRGETDRRLADGSYNLVPPTSEPFFPLRVKIVAGLGVIALIAATVAKRIYLDPFLPSKR